MFSLHDNTRIAWCRLAFVALCLLPTCGVVAWCVAVRGPGYRETHERAIHDALGWHARLQGVGLPRPGMTLYQGLEVSDAESGQLLAHAPFLEIESDGGATAVTLPFPATINGLRLDALLRSAERLLRLADRAGEATLSAHNVTLHSSGGDHTLTNVSGRLQRDADGKRLTLSFALAGATKDASPTASPAQVEMLLAAPGDAAAPCSVKFTTGGTPLPCALIGSYWPAAGRLGAACTFDGRITATRRAGQWRLEMSGQLRAVDLARLLEPFPHKLTGTADIHIEHATVVDGRLENATGKLVAGPGVISRSLVHAAQQHLGLEPSRTALSGRDNRLEYRQLNLAFAVDEQGLALRGEFPKAAGAIL
ncbi:MAG: hypothetical protein WD845_12515, partial [Pirellulales bacterium]